MPSFSGMEPGSATSSPPRCWELPLPAAGSAGVGGDAATASNSSGGGGAGRTRLRSAAAPVGRSTNRQLATTTGSREAPLRLLVPAFTGGHTAACRSRSGSWPCSRPARDPRSCTCNVPRLLCCAAEAAGAQLVCWAVAEAAGQHAGAGRVGRLLRRLEKQARQAVLSRLRRPSLARVAANTRVLWQLRQCVMSLHVLLKDFVKRCKFPQAAESPEAVQAPGLAVLRTSPHTSRYITQPLASVSTLPQRHNPSARQQQPCSAFRK